MVVNTFAQIIAFKIIFENDYRLIIYYRYVNHFNIFTFTI